MRKLLARLLITTAAAAPAGAGQPNPAWTAFARTANSPAGRAAYELAPPRMTAGTETWRYAGIDTLPFHDEQGVAFDGSDELVFSSRNSLTRTAAGCPSALDVYGPCYDVAVETAPAIPRAEFEQGFNHIGGIDIGLAGPAEGFVFAPLETDPPRTRRGYMAYDLATLSPAGKLIETIPHRYQSWVAVDPSGNWLITAEDTMDPIRVHSIESDGSSIRIARRADLDVTGTTSARPVPNFQGCAFDPRDATARTLYCANWKKSGFNHDEGTEIWRVDLSAPIGTPGATASAAVAFTMLFTERYGATDNVPYGLETEGITFYPVNGQMQMHVQLRGEGLAWTYLAHLAP